jgi:hypothetical protein
MGKIEKSVRAAIAGSVVPAMTTRELCAAIHGSVTKSKRVSMLRVMRKVAESEPGWDLGEIETREFDSETWRNNVFTEKVLYDATSIEATNRANWGDVQTDIDDPLDGHYATFAHHRALRRVAGEDTTAFESEWTRRRDIRMERFFARSRALLAGQPTPEAEREQLLKAVKAGLSQLLDLSPDAASITVTARKTAGEGGGVDFEVTTGVE